MRGSFAAFGAVSVGAVLAIATAAAGDEPDATRERPSLVIIRLPADASLEIDGVLTRQSGEVREFDTPPLPVGKTYWYAIKATWSEGDKVVTRQARAVVRAGGTTELDLRKEPTLPPPAVKPAPPVPSLKIEAPATLELVAGGKAVLPVKVLREHVPGTVTVTLEGLPESVRRPTVLIGSDRQEASIELEAPTSLREETIAAKVIARAEAVQAEAVVRVTVRAPAVVKSFTVSVPESLVLVPGGPRRLLPVTVVRNDLKGPVQLRFQGAPAGVLLPEAIVPAGKSKIYVSVEAGNEAEAIEAAIKVIATCEDTRAETALKIKVAR